MKTIPVAPSFRHLLFLVLLLYALSGQTQSKNFLLQSYGYGPAGGFALSNFTGDSTGYLQTAMPYGGLFYTLGLKNNFGASIAANYFIKGINRSTPYERYRYPYFSGEVTAHYQLLGFINLEVGYRYGFAQTAKKLVLDGSKPNGVERTIIPGLGHYGQWIAGTSIQISPTTLISFGFGIPGNNTPMSHIQIGIRYKLSNKEGLPSIQEMVSDKDISRLQSGQLKEGILLVRLKSMRSSIELLEKGFLTEEADKLKILTDKENQEVIKAFSQYTFSKVLFFYDINSQLVKEGKLDSVLLNASLEPVIADTPLGMVFIAELGLYASPTTSYYVKHDFQYLKEHKISPDSTAAWIAYNDKGLGIGGIVIMDQYFEPLSEPFPVFSPVSNRTIFHNNRSIERAVMNLNEALITLYYGE